MDNLIKSYKFVEYGDDLNYCYEVGIMYQKDMDKLVEYNSEYFSTYVQREDTEIANRINLARTSIVEKYCDCVLDVGIGSGEFIRKLNIPAYGYDINPLGVQWLKDRSLFVDIYKDKTPDEVDGFTLWDTLEHIPNPQELFACLRENEFMFVSLPIFNEIELVRSSKHYKPNEHLYYFTKSGLIRFVEDSGFTFVEYNENETLAGREGIGTFVFVKD